MVFLLFFLSTDVPSSQPSQGRHKLPGLFFLSPVPGPTRHNRDPYMPQHGLFAMHMRHANAPARRACLLQVTSAPGRPCLTSCPPLPFCIASRASPVPAHVMAIYRSSTRHSFLSPSTNPPAWSDSSRLVRQLHDLTASSIPRRLQFLLLPQTSEGDTNRPTSPTPWHMLQATDNQHASRLPGCSYHQYLFCISHASSNHHCSHNNPTAMT